jgi:hypothetical protein
MRLGLLVAIFFSSCVGNAQEPFTPAKRGDLGVRWWVSTGETKISHNAQNLDPTAGNPTSVLEYNDLDAHALELFGRQNFRNDFFLKGVLGVGRINSGAFEDEDFNLGQVKFSDTTSAVPQGRIDYALVDVGRHWVLRQGAVSLGVFAGFAQWREGYDAFGATDHLGFIGGDISRDVNVVSNKVRWRALRLGVAGEFAMRSARLMLDLAAVPYAEMRNEDSHHLRADLGPVPNIIDKGHGWGVQLDAELRYEIARRTELGIGARYWYMELSDGTTDFHNFANAETPLVEFYTRRTGLMLSLRRTW